MVRLFYHIEKIDVRRKTLVVSKKISIKTTGCAQVETILNSC